MRPFTLFLAQKGSSLYPAIRSLRSLSLVYYVYPRPKLNMTMENPPFEDAFPIEHCDFPMSC